MHVGNGFMVGKKASSYILGEDSLDDAKSAMRNSLSDGNWVILCNCHLVPQWLPELENLFILICTNSQKNLTQGSDYGWCRVSTNRFLRTLSLIRCAWLFQKCIA